MKHLILGGARSGKSRYAEQCAKQTKKKLVYIATAEAGDPEMAKRIGQHKRERSSDWQLFEVNHDLASVFEKINNEKYAVVVDCLTLWLSNCLAQECFESQNSRLLAALPNLSCDIYLVSNEVGSGVVPLGELSRTFVDASGRLHQDLGKLCDRVTLTVAGFPLALKGP